jgi:hypothetical protein
MEQRIDPHFEKINVNYEKIIAIIKEGLGRAEDKRKPTPEETEAVAEPQEVPEGATGVDTIGATDDRFRDLRLAAGCRGQLNTRTKHDGGSRQECAAAVGRPTRHTLPATRKGGLRKGPGMKCRRSVIKGRGKASGNGMKGRIMKRRRRLDRKKKHSEAIRKSLHMEITKLIFELIWHVLTSVAMATDKHATMDNNG